MQSSNFEDWHFDLGHLRCDQEFVLHLQGREYPISPHTADSLKRAVEANPALRLIPASKITHFAEQTAAPADAVALWRVTVAAEGEQLERLILTGIHIPRSVRADGIAKRRQQGRVTVPPVLAGVPADDPSDDDLLNITNFRDASDAAASLIFHHPEIMSLQPGPADNILSIVSSARGLNALAESILEQSQAHEADPVNNPNWVITQNGVDYKTRQPTANMMYVWSPTTVEFLGFPLRDTLMRTKDEMTLEGQCWTIQPGVTEVPVSASPASMTSTGAGSASFADVEGFTLKQLTPQAGVTASFVPTTTAGGTFSLTNYYLRWLQISVDQYGPGGEAIGTTKPLGLVAPVDTILAIPLPAQPTDFDLDLDPGASRVVISFGGLGKAPFTPKYDAIGITLTSIFNLVIPAAFIVMGVAVDKLGNWTKVQKLVIGEISSVIEAEAESIGTTIATGEGTDLEGVSSEIGSMLGSVLINMLTASPTLAAFFTEAGVESGNQKIEVFVGWVAWAVGAAADLASIIETSVEVGESPATMSVDIVRTMDVQVSVEPDKMHPGHFPETATQYEITLTYDDGPNYVYSGVMDLTTQPVPLVHTFNGLPAGGSFTVLASFYSDNGWLAGKGVSPSITAVPSEGNTLVAPPFNIVENLVPLTAATTYHCKEKLGYVNNERVWLPTPTPPAATVSVLDQSNVGANLWQLQSLGLNEPLSAVGYAYQASGQNVPLVDTPAPYTGQMSTYQNVSDAADPQTGLKFCAAGYTAKALLAYPPPTAVNPAADGFLLEPVGAEVEVMQLRALSLGTGKPFLGSRSVSFGSFTGGQDDLVIHPSGYAVALSTSTCKLQFLKLEAQMPDAEAPTAFIRAGQGTRAGLLSNPVALTSTLSTILVLESGDKYPQGCIAAFDLRGNPVYYFPSGQRVSLKTESTQVVPLDISVESKGYIYVLKYLQRDGGPVAASDYRLDIYDPDGTLLTQITGLAAARLHVDLWRNIYTLNYEIVEGTGRTEPSVALWIPSTPT